MKISLLAFGIAKDILHTRKLELELNQGATVAMLRQRLLSQYPEFEKLKSLSFAVGEDYCGEDHSLRNGDEVAIIPPVSGG